MKKMIHVFLLAALLITLSACAGNSADVTTVESNSQTEDTWVIEQSAQVVATNQVAAASGVTIGEYDADDLDASLDSSGMSFIKLDGDAITFEGSGATLDGSTITITTHLASTASAEP